MGVSAEDHWRALVLLHRYCRAIDHHDEPALRDVFSEDAMLVVRPGHADAKESALRGRDAVVQALASLFARRSWARHIVSNELVERVEDGSLTISCYFSFVLADAPGRVEGLGDYEAHLVESGDRLAVARLSVSILERTARPVT
jgi:SnoaL-like domain